MYFSSHYVVSAWGRPGLHPGCIQLQSQELGRYHRGRPPHTRNTNCSDCFLLVGAYRALFTKTTRIKNSFFPWAVSHISPHINCQLHEHLHTTALLYNIPLSNVNVEMCLCILINFPCLSFTCPRQNHSNQIVCLHKTGKKI